MTDSVVINTNEDSVVVIDPDIDVAITITEENIAVNDVINTAVIVDPEDNIAVTDTETLVAVSDSSDTLNIAFDEVVTVRPKYYLEEEPMYSSRVDWIDDYTLYKGEAEPGTLESGAVWRIRKITIGLDDDVTTLWASGTDAFTQIWDDRLSLSYS